MEPRTPAAPDFVRPPAVLAWAVSLALAIAWSAIRIAFSAGSPIPLTYVLPLLVGVWARRRPAVWTMAAIFVVVHTVQTFGLVSARVLDGRQWEVWGVTLVNVLVGAAVVHLIIGLRDRLESAVAAARASEEQVREQAEELQAQSEELAQQNSELTEQSEELAQQNEELQAQSDQIHRLNEDLSTREALLEALLDAARLSVAEGAAVERICAAAHTLVTDAAAVVVYERANDALMLRGVAPASLAGRTPPTLALHGSFVSLVLEHNRTASLPDTALRRDLTFLEIEDGKPFGSVLCAPLPADGRAVGAIAIYAHGPREWTEEEFQLAEWLARQCAVMLGMLRVQANLARRAAMIDLSPDAIIVRRRDGTVTFWSRGAETMYGYTWAEAVGRSCDELLQTRGAVSREALDAELDRTGRWSGELTQRRRDGREVVVESRCLLENRPDGLPAEVIESNVDVTLLKEADRRKNEFLATLSHELRNPLAAMRYALELLGRGTESSDGRPQQVIERQLAHLVRLVDDLLDITRVGSNKFQLRRQHVDLPAVVQQAIDAVAPDVAGARHVLDVSWPDERLVLDADPDRLAQVVINLLTNSVRYTPPGGRIRLEVTSAGSDAVITVTDTGVGLSPEQVPRVFDMFTQFAGPGQGGLGIGLALVKAVVDLHGGSVDVYSEGIGRGTRFVVRLPLGQTSCEDAGPLSPAAAGPTVPQRILVVEDNADVAEMFQIALGLDGHAVRLARTAQAGLAALDDFTPDVALLDIGLPDADGYELARRLRADPRTRGAYLVAITGWGQDGDRQRARDAGFDAHLTKPVEFTDVSRLIGAAAARKQGAPSG